jgi:hypothetical protein
MFNLLITELQVQPPYYRVRGPTSLLQSYRFNLLITELQVQPPYYRVTGSTSLSVTL